MTYDAIPRKPGTFSAMALFAILSTLAACSDSRGGPDQTRPVLTFRVAAETASLGMSFAGEIKARHETTLSFRVAGKLASRPAELGDTVRKGQLLASLDAADYKLAVQTVKAQLASARAELEFTREDLQRYRELLDQRVVSPPEFDRRRTAFTAAKERVAALEAQLGQTANQVDYTELRADRDGAVTAVSAETGQVLAAGQPVLTLARLDEPEVSADIPEHRVGVIHPGQEVAVTLWADGRRLKARVREIAAAADPASRTYRVRATLLEGKDSARLGMTATLWIDAAGPEGAAIPLSAVFSPQQQPDPPRVWLVDEAQLTVRSAPVRLGEVLSAGRVAVEGLAPGQLVVSAGVQRLAEGQKVRILPDSAGRRP
jgi:multidrug efflux system membrane fusion protein